MSRLDRSLITIVLLSVVVRGVFAQATPPVVPAGAANEAEFVGEMEAISAASITVGGIDFDISAAEVEFGLAAGDTVRVHATFDAGAWLAREVERVSGAAPGSRPAGEFEITGVLTASGSDFIVVAGQTITVTGAEINDTLALGDLVTAHVTLVSGELVAREVELARSDAPSCATATPRGWEDYRVRAGDTLSSIAARTGTTVAELARVNCITDTGLLIAGTVLFIPDVPGSDIGNDNVDDHGSDNEDNGNDNVDDHGSDNEDNGNDNVDDHGSDNGNDNSDDHDSDNGDDHGNDNGSDNEHEDNDNGSDNED